MEKTTTHSEPEHIGTIIEQWFKRFELIAYGDATLTKGKTYPVISVDFRFEELAVRNDDDMTEWIDFDKVPDFFEIRIREA